MTAMGMPETAVDKDGSPVFTNPYIGFTGNAYGGNAVAESALIQPLSDSKLGAGIPPSDCLHISASVFRYCAFFQSLPQDYLSRLISCF